MQNVDLINKYTLTNKLERQEIEETKGQKERKYMKMRMRRKNIQKI